MNIEVIVCVAGFIIIGIIIYMLSCGTLEYSLNKESCLSNRREEIVRHHLRDLFDKPFERVRPDWLVNPKTGKYLELDCYNNELKLAAEVNGEQHYVFPNTFHRTEEEFKAQQERDNIKKEICKERGIYLLEIPYTIPKSQIRDYIKQKTYKKI